MGAIGRHFALLPVERANRFRPFWGNASVPKYAPRKEIERAGAAPVGSRGTPWLDHGAPTFNYLKVGLPYC